MNFKITKRPNPRVKGSYLFHASPFYSDELTILDLAKDISDGCTLNVTDVEAVLSSLVRKLPLFLKKRLYYPAWLIRKNPAFVQRERQGKSF